MLLQWVHNISILLFTFSDAEHQRKSNVTIAIANAIAIHPMVDSKDKASRIHCQPVRLKTEFPKNSNE